MDAKVPTLADVRAAQKRIAPHLRETPFHAYPALDGVLGFQAFVKHENTNPTGAFKVRGGINLVAQLAKTRSIHTVVGASTGNHGQSIAYAARLFGRKAVISVPEGANPAKVEAMQRLGAKVEVHGKDFDEARAWIEARRDTPGWRYVHSGDEPDLIAGVGTYALDMLTLEPDLDAIFVPVGGGSGAAGCCIVAKGLGGGTRVIGVQSEAAPAAFRSWKTRTIQRIPSRTNAEGLATGVGFELPQRILRESLADFRLVTDAQIEAALVLLLEKTHQVAENAGAAPLAAAYADRRAWKGKKVGLVLSGGNITMDRLRALLAH